MKGVGAGPATRRVPLGDRRPDRIPEGSCDGAALLVSVPQGKTVDEIVATAARAGVSGARPASSAARTGIWAAAEAPGPVPTGDERAVEPLTCRLGPPHAPRRLDSRPYGGKEQRARPVATIFQSCRRPSRRSARDRGAIEAIARPASIGGSNRTARRATARLDRHAVFGLDPASIGCGAGARRFDESPGARLSRRRRPRRFIHEARIWYRSRRSGGRQAVVAPDGE